MSKSLPPVSRHTIDNEITSSSFTPGKNKSVSYNLRYDFIEKKIKFLGTVTDVNKYTDINSRSVVLTLLDAEKRKSVLPWTCACEQHDVLLTLCAYELKATRLGVDDNLQCDVLLRLPMCEIESASYIRDIPHHVIVMKFGNPVSESCNLGVFHAPDAFTAIELCNLLSECFHILQTDVTLQSFSHLLSDTPENSESSYTLVATPLPRSECEGSASVATSVFPQSMKRDVAKFDSDNSMDSDSILSQPAREFLHDFIFRLQRFLSASELRDFGELLSRLKEDALHRENSYTDIAHNQEEGDGITVERFCSRIISLFGKDKTSYFLELRHFIPSCYFRAFMQILFNENIISLQDYNFYLSQGKVFPLGKLARSVSESYAQENFISSFFKDVPYEAGKEEKK